MMLFTPVGGLMFSVIYFGEPIFIRAKQNSLIGSVGQALNREMNI